MKTWIIVKKDDLSIQGSYEAMEKDDSSANRSWLLAEPVCMHLEMPEGMDKDCVKCEADAIVLDEAKAAAKLQAQREAKLALMRSMRATKLLEVDIMVNELALDKRADKAAVALYRDQLVGITDAYKEQDGSAKSTLDDLNADLSDLSWPMKP